MRCSHVLLSILLYLFNASNAIEVIVDPDNHSYHIDTNHEAVLIGSNIAVFVAGRWCVQGEIEMEQNIWPMELQQIKNFEGFDSGSPPSGKLRCNVATGSSLFSLGYTWVITVPAGAGVN